MIRQLPMSQEPKRTISLTEFPEFPPYTYVPGHAVHPVSHPHGHMREGTLPQDWSQQQYLQWGRQLFNKGYYWEAHEAWEHLWMELGRTSANALTVKGLIKLAASAVKCREGNASGAIRHAQCAAELLQEPCDSKLFAGCDLSLARDSANRLREAPLINFAPSSDRPVVLHGVRV